MLIDVSRSRKFSILNTKKCKKNGPGFLTYCVIWCIAPYTINHWKPLFNDKSKIKPVCLLCVKMCV